MPLAIVVATLVSVGVALAPWQAVANRAGGAGQALFLSRLDYRLGDRSSQPADAGLISRLAVLQRAQAPSDVLPAGVDVTGVHGMIIASLTRLVASLPGATLYLAVSTPAPGSPPLWSPRMGDQVGIVTVTASGATETFPVPAVDLPDGFAVALVGGGTGAGSTAYQVGIVPDGVARVRWTFANQTAKRTYVTDVQASDNIAITPLQSGTPFLLRATWFAADGSVIPTSDSALRHAIEARDNVLRKRVIRQDARSSFQPSAAILAAFAVFNVTSRTGVRIGDLTISHPRLSSVPLPILGLTRPRRRLQLDPEDMREATTDQRVSVWITPGRQGICVAVVTEPHFPFRYGTGGGEGCSGSIALAEAHGAGVSICCFSGYGWHYGVLPNAHPTITIRTGPNTRKTIQPPDGVYIYRTRSQADDASGADRLPVATRR